MDCLVTQQKLLTFFLIFIKIFRLMNLIFDFLRIMLKSNEKAKDSLIGSVQ